MRMEMPQAGPQGSEQGPEAQHIAPGLEASAAELESLRKKPRHLKRTQRKRENCAIIGPSSRSRVTGCCLEPLVGSDI